MQRAQGTWPIEGDATAELQPKPAESLCWTFVLANKFEIDIDLALTETRSTIQINLHATIEGTAPPGNIPTSLALALI
ncbi:hypothetical protein [Cryobacterium sp. Hb1]|uniref:hypothetical protein n=1 Tax=Cryobacterium sp. Hb1 TaxID=1259147 RepID=UPI00106AC5BE|nr:hypothetical protein [Cryobacterium sp. Hb1]TFD70445.1 hypothetical protein E3T38_05245 [Cryobacterium sp. Hb1]